MVSFNYSFFNEKVKKLKQWSLSAGNYFNITKYGTSETLCSETVEILESIKEISVHVPKHIKPISEEQFGNYLAGLIDGSGQFNEKLQLIIEFHSLDASLAYYIKKRIGYGSVKKLTNRDAIIYILSSKEGLQKAISLINGKFRNETIYDQIKTNVLNNNIFAEYNKNINLKIRIDTDFKNHWLAGFSDSNASFHINFINLKNNNTEIRLNFKILQVKISLLLLIKEFLGGNISYDKNDNIYCYDSSSFGSAKNIIDYLDHYHLLSTKQVNYLK